MNALLAAITIAVIPVVGLWVLHLFAFIAEYTRNPVIELVEELREKHRDLND